MNLMTKRVRFNHVDNIKEFINDSLFERTMQFPKYRLKMYVDINDIPTSDYMLINKHTFIHAFHTGLSGSREGMTFPINVYSIGGFNSSYLVGRLITTSNYIPRSKVVKSALNEYVSMLKHSRKCELIHQVRDKHDLINPCSNYLLFYKFRKLGFDGTELLASTATHASTNIYHVVYPKATHYTDPTGELGCSYSINIFSEYHGIVSIYNAMKNYYVELLMNRGKVSSMLMQTFDRSCILGRFTKKQNVMFIRGNYYNIKNCYIKGTHSPQLFIVLNNGRIIKYGHY
jgi:hypothetical protein